MQSHTLIIASLGLALLSGCALGIGSAGNTVARGQTIFSKECAQCHGIKGEGGGAASLGLGRPAPKLTDLKTRNDGIFPREFVQDYVLGAANPDDPEAPMPEFRRVGLRHVYPNGGTEAEVSKADITALLDYLETIQK